MSLRNADKVNFGLSYEGNREVPPPAPVKPHKGALNCIQQTTPRHGPAGTAEQPP